MTIANGSFEDAGAEPGLADGWDSTHVGTAEAFADFDQNPSDAFTRAVESYETGWASAGDQAALLELGGETEGTEAAIFQLGPSQRPHEDHEMGWGDPPLWMPTLSALETGQFDGSDHESHDWVTFLPTLPAPTAATFSGNPEERHEAGWSTAFIAAFGGGDVSSPFTETYESVYAATVFTADPSTDTLTVVSTPAVAFVDNEQVFLANEGGSLPSPLNEDVGYFVSDPVAESFQLSPQSGGAEIDITSLGEGTHRVTRNPATYWSRVMATV